jgi:hypothetical protein
MYYLTALCSLLHEAVRLKENRVGIMLKTAFSIKEA